MDGTQATGLFENDEVRIGPPALKKNHFKMPGRGGKLRYGKKWEIPQYLHDMGLNAYEFSAGRLSKFSDSEKYEKFRVNVEKYDVKTSIHAPYYISFTSKSEETYKKSIERTAKVYAWATYLNATRIVLHPGSYGGIHKRKNKDLMAMIGNKKKSHSTNFKEQLEKLITKIVEGIQKGIKLSYEMFPNRKNQFKKICICPETMGKHGQLGTIEEVIEICKRLGTDIARPCVDFGHMYARHVGRRTGRKLYEEVFKKVEDELGTHVLKNLHIHYSHIAFTKKGEEKHVPNNHKKFGPKVRPLLEIIKEQDLTPTIINESPELEPDAKKIMDEWVKMNS